MHPTSIPDQVDYFTPGTHIPQHFDHSGDRLAKCHYNAGSLATSTNLSIQMTYFPPLHSTPTTTQPSSQPSPSLEQIRSSTANMPKSDYCAGHSSRDAPFAAFRLCGGNSHCGPDASMATVVIRTKDVDSAIQTVSRVFASTGSSSSLTSGGTSFVPGGCCDLPVDRRRDPAVLGAMPGPTKRYPAEITDEDLLGMNARDMSPRS
jgi:hypothetical protein